MYRKVSCAVGNKLTVGVEQVAYIHSLVPSLGCRTRCVRAEQKVRPRRKKSSANMRERELKWRWEEKKIRKVARRAARYAVSGLPPSDCVINEQSIEPVRQPQSTRPHKIYSSRAAHSQNQTEFPLQSCLSAQVLSPPPPTHPLHTLTRTLRLYLNTITAGAVKIYFVDKVKQGALGVCVCATAVCRRRMSSRNLCFNYSSCASECACLVINLR